jgi:hypothetical protein
VTIEADDIPADGLPSVADRTPGEPEPTMEPGLEGVAHVEAPAVTVTIEVDDISGDGSLPVPDGATAEPVLASDPGVEGAAPDVVAPAVTVRATDESVKVSAGDCPELALEAEAEGEPAPFVDVALTGEPEGAGMTGAGPVE